MINAIVSWCCAELPNGVSCLKLQCCAGAFADGATPVHSPSPGGGSIMLADVPEDSASSWSAAGTPMGGRSVSSSTSASNWGR